MALFGNHTLTALTVAQHEVDRHSSSVVPVASLMYVMPYPSTTNVPSHSRGMCKNLSGSVTKGFNPLYHFLVPL
jgi:hypothetical protein